MDIFQYELDGGFTAPGIEFGREGYVNGAGSHFLLHQAGHAESDGRQLLRSLADLETDVAAPKLANGMRNGLDAVGAKNGGWVPATERFETGY